ncbi:MAG: hypothetical protein FJX68_12880, partial [Alphaproteobacteria bacterium]|nr:hypothetical protein [Alphaproteobacteria bacterium]
MNAATARPYQVCVRCVMDTSDPAIAFDERGVCNHCRGHAAPRAFDRAHEAGRFDFSSAGGLLRSLARHSGVFSLG